MSTNSITFSWLNLHELGNQITFGLSGVCDGFSFSLHVCPLKLYLKIKPVHKRLINQYITIGTNKVSKVTDEKLSVWETNVFKNFVSR